MNPRRLLRPRQSPQPRRPRRFVKPLDFVTGLVEQIEHEGSLAKLYAQLLLKEVIHNQASDELRGDLADIVAIVREEKQRTAATPG